MDTEEAAAAAAACIHHAHDSILHSSRLIVHDDDITTASQHHHTKPVAEPSLGPLTPDSTKEYGDFPLDLTSPLSALKNLPGLLTFNSSQPTTNTDPFPTTVVDDSTTPKTPQDGVFDPFAPGPDDKALAPLCNKYSKDARPIVARRLDFTSIIKYDGCSARSGDVDSLTDEQLFESVYENLLEAILLQQTECALSQLSNLERDPDTCTTPPSAPRLSGVAHTCPGAPFKQTGKSRIIGLGLCRKLEF